MYYIAKDDKKLTNAVELCIICQWEWKIWGAGASIKDAISAWQYWTVWISHPLWGISEGQINAWWFFFLFLFYLLSFCLLSILSLWVRESNYQLMDGGWFLPASSQRRGCWSAVNANKDYKLLQIFTIKFIKKSQKQTE